MKTTRKSYPSDVPDAEWQFLAPFFTFTREDAPQREIRCTTSSTRCVSSAVFGDICRMTFRLGRLLSASPAMEFSRASFWVTHDLRVIVRIIEDLQSQSSDVIFDARTMQSTPESVARAGFDGSKKKEKRSKTHAAVDTLGSFDGDARQRNRAQPGAGSSEAGSRDDRRNRRDRVRGPRIHAGEEPAAGAKSRSCPWASALSMIS